jgi:hypothetical protein
VIAEGGHIDGMSMATEPSTEEESDCNSTAVPDLAWRQEDSLVSSMEISDDESISSTEQEPTLEMIRKEARRSGRDHVPINRKRQKVVKTTSPQ